MGISSMNRISQGCARLRFTKSAISSSLNPPMRTVSNFKSRNPAASAARMPSSTSRRVPSRVMAANRSGRRVSRLMFSRSNPASRRGFASWGSRRTVGGEAQLLHAGDGPQHPAQVQKAPAHQGLPAGEADLLHPALPPPPPAISASSSRERMSSWGRFSTPSGGIQYWHR